MSNPFLAAVLARIGASELLHIIKKFQQSIIPSGKEIKIGLHDVGAMYPTQPSCEDLTGSSQCQTTVDCAAKSRV